MQDNKNGGTPSFDLEDSVAIWRAAQASRGVYLVEDLDELEQHLRESTSYHLGRGMDLEAAFHKALSAVGDLEEGAREYGKVYWGKFGRQHRMTTEINWRVSMIRHHLYSAIRNLRRHQGFTALNVAGLGLGLVCSILIVLFVLDELSFDQFHDNSDRIYRVIQASPDDWALKTDENMSPLLGPAMATQLPEVDHAVRFWRRGQTLVSSGEGLAGLYEDDFVYADSNVFEVFSLPLIQGNPGTALDQPLTVVLSESEARKHFGDDSPLGKTIRVNNADDFVVTGVAEDLPAHSSLQVGYLASFSSLNVLKAESGMVNSGWGVSAYPTYVLLVEGGRSAAVDEKLPGLLASLTSRSHVTGARFGLEPLTRIHLYSKASNLLGPQSDVRDVYMFSTLAALILLMACVNYINMVTARAERRRREVGIRKVIGAHRSQLARQFLGESLAVSLLATGAAIGVVWALLGPLGRLVGRHITAEPFSEPGFWLILLSLALVVGVISGSYPAFILSRYSPVGVLKGSRGRSGSKSKFRQVLVGFQFFVSMSLIASTLIMDSQLDYVRSARLGLNSEQVLVLKVPSTVSGQPNPIADQSQAFQTELRQIAALQTVGYASAVPSRRASRWVYSGETGEQTSVSLYRVDQPFVQALELRLVSGQDFAIGSDNSESEAIINETAMRLFGWSNPEEAIGQDIPLRIGSIPMIVHGVMRDFHFDSFHAAIAPVMLKRIGARKPGFVVARVEPLGMQATLRAVEAVWSKFSPEYPFEYFFLDDSFDGLYKAEDRLATIFGAFAWAAVFIAFLGLFGLTAYMAETRTKEIGIRKVLGASVVRIVALLSRDFALLILLAFLVTVPVVYLQMQTWLEEFAYRVEVGWSVFLLAGGLAAVLTLITVSIQGWRAAVADPIESLRQD